jgi:hypothetical protein
LGWHRVAYHVQTTFFTGRHSDLDGRKQSLYIFLFRPPKDFSYVKVQSSRPLIPWKMNFITQKNFENEKELKAFQAKSNLF